ncbi:MAG: DUF2510 domain-containing protein [Acidimicrobiales bacterium]
MSTDPGWYPDPDDPTTMRWWDGNGWTSDTAAPTGPQPLTPVEVIPPSQAPPPGYAARPPGVDAGPYGPPSGPPAAPQPWYPPPGPPPAPPPKRNRLPLVIGGVVVVALLIAGGAFVLLRKPALTFDGRAIDRPERTLSGAEDTLEAIVEERHGAKNDGSRCYFSLPNADTSDVNDFLRCGPVLFVDGDPDEPYLIFPLETEAGDGDAIRLVAADEPESPEPSGLGRQEVLRRPDDVGPPDGSGGLEAPPPPPADAGLFEVNPLDDVDLDVPGSDASIVSLSQAYNLVGLAQPDRFGQGDDARRPADGEKFVAVQIERDLGEDISATPPDVAIQIGENPPVPVPEEVRNAITPVGLIVSVPDETELVDLVVTEVGIEQRLSLLTGEPAPLNISVLRRENRSQTLGASQALTITVSKPGFVSETDTVTVTVNRVDLVWFFGEGGAQHPADPNNAFLVVDVDYAWPPDVPVNTGLTSGLFSLTPAGGGPIPAINLATDPTKVLVAFEVPNTFTQGTITIAGRSTNPGGFTEDLGGGQFPVPISIPEG